MFVSVVMATYNGAKFVDVQLRSIIEQSRPPDEIIICDDQSSDGSLEIIRETLRGYQGAVGLHRNSERLGYTRNFERALGLSRGDVVFFSDQDDIWDHQKIEKTLHFLTQNPDARLVVNNMFLANERLVSDGVTMLDLLATSKRNDVNLIHGCATAIRGTWREVLLPIPAGEWSYDVWMHKLSARLGVRAVNVEPLQTYRRHQQNASGLPERTRLRERLLPRLGFHAESAGGFRAQAAQLVDMRDRILGMRERNHDIAPLGQVALSLSEIDAQLGAIARRDELLRESLPKRAVSSLGFLLEGGYRRFSGVGSFLKDLAGRRS